MGTCESCSRLSAQVAAVRSFLEPHHLFGNECCECGDIPHGRKVCHHCNAESCQLQAWRDSTENISTAWLAQHDQAVREPLLQVLRTIAEHLATEGPTAFSSDAPAGVVEFVDLLTAKLGRIKSAAQQTVLQLNQDVKDERLSALDITILHAALARLNDALEGSDSADVWLAQHDAALTQPLREKIAELEGQVEADAAIADFADHTCTDECNTHGGCLVWARFQHATNMEKYDAAIIATARREAVEDAIRCVERAYAQDQTIDGIVAVLRAKLEEMK